LVRKNIKVAILKQDIFFVLHKSKVARGKGGGLEWKEFLFSIMGCPKQP